MNDPFVFYRALDPQKGSWDGYSFFPQGHSDFLAYVADAPSGASIETPELIRKFWNDYVNQRSQKSDSGLGRLDVADAINRMQDFLRKRSRADAALYQSTFTIVVKKGNTLFHAAIGDSPAFLLRKNSLYRLDSAETWNGALVIREGEELLERQQTSAIQFVGVDGAFIEPLTIGSLELQPGDRIVLSSDGIFDSLPPGRLLALLLNGQEALRKELERLPSQDDRTLLAIEPEVQVAPDVTAEIRKELHEVKNENARLQREIARVPALITRMETLERKLAERKREPAARSTIADAPRVIETASHSHRKLAAWAGGAFAVGLAVGLSLFLWMRGSEPGNAATDASQRQQSAQPLEKRPVNPPQITPADPADCDYEVQSGDTLSKIAGAHRINVEDLVRWNPQLRGSGVLQIGQKLRTCAGESQP